jgi:ubiquinone/menaquinone biosynthesis C-methylase UbiE
MISDKDRLIAEYANRSRRLVGSDIYSISNPANLFMVQQRQRETLRILTHKGFFPLNGKPIFEIGSGRGLVLLEHLSYGAQPSGLHGVDLLLDRLCEARSFLPHSIFINADGQSLPFQKSKFDLVLQFTAFSSVLDDQVKTNIASEMLRVMKPDGMILWYDFWLNPTNKQTKGIRKPEIRRLFPDCSYEFNKITLAPPIARRLVPISWILCMMLEKLKIFNTHYLCVIRKLG